MKSKAYMCYSLMRSSRNSRARTAVMPAAAASPLPTRDSTRPDQMVKNGTFQRSGVIVYRRMTPVYTSTVPPHKFSQC